MQSTVREYQDLRGVFEERLSAWLATQTGGVPEPLREAVYYASASGKRMRPLLCLAAAEACGGGFDQAVAPAIALELVHCYSLVHDDLPAIDNDMQRRGRPTVHAAFGEAQAILAGDALLTMAFAAISDNRLGSLPADRRLGLVAELALAAGALGMVAGQVDELASAANSPAVDPVDLARRVAAGKTGAMMRAAARMGAIAAGADPFRLAALTRFGESYGLAYQVLDDLSDRSKDSDAGRDLNYALLLGAEGAARLVRQLCDEADAALQGVVIPRHAAKGELPRMTAALRAAALGPV